MYRGNLNRKYAEWDVWFGIYVILMHSILEISLNRMSKPGANENRSGRGKQNLFWDMCSLRMYSKKQVVFHDVLLAQKTALKVIWTSRFRQGHPTIVVPPHVGCLRLYCRFQNYPAHVWNGGFLTWQGNLTGCGGRGGDSSCTVDGEHGRSPSVFLWPFCSFPAV